MLQQQVTIPTLIVAALIDSLNPCAFALLMIFVATMLSMAQRQVDGPLAQQARRWLLSRGSIYILGIFLTYLALGFGLFGTLQVAKLVSSTHFASRIAAIFALGLGLLALQEALLPEFGTRLSGHADAPRIRRWVSTLGVPGLFGAGVLVGLCTVPCAGSVYLGILALLSAQSTFLVGAYDLVLYNLVFIAPLVTMLLLASSAPVYRRLARWQLHNRTLLKLGTSAAGIMVGLLTLLIV